MTMNPMTSKAGYSYQQTAIGDDRDSDDISKDSAEVSDSSSSITSIEDQSDDDSVNPMTPMVKPL
jgi:hypothetical protein